MDDDTVSLLVMEWESHQSEVQTLLNSLRTNRSRDIFRRLQKFSVNVYQRDYDRLRATITDDMPGIHACSLPYSNDIGLVPNAPYEVLIF
jgi:hypothetical protein